MMMMMAPDDVTTLFTSTATWNPSFISLAQEDTKESWRQYVPLVVSGLVLIDIALGSPAANAVLRRVRPSENKEEKDEEEGSSLAPTSPLEALQVNLFPKGEIGSGAVSSEQQSKERIDSVAVAQQALQKAEATLELKRFLEENKSDWDKMNDLQRKMDQDLQAFDERQEEVKKNTDEGRP